MNKFVLSEAMRQAKVYIKATITAKGGEPSHFTVGEITKCAKLVLKAEPRFLRKAKAKYYRMLKTAD